MPSSRHATLPSLFRGLRAIAGKDKPGVYRRFPALLVNYVHTHLPFLMLLLQRTRIPYLGHGVALALQALGVCERLLAQERGGVHLTDGPKLRASPTLG